MVFYGFYTLTPWDISIYVAGATVPIVQGHSAAA